MLATQEAHRAIEAQWRAFLNKIPQSTEAKANLSNPESSKIEILQCFWAENKLKVLCETDTR